MKKLVILLLLLLLLSSCSLKVDPAPDSGFLSDYSKLQMDTEKVFFRRSFFKEKDIVLNLVKESKEKKKIYISTVDISHLTDDQKSDLPESRYEDLAKFFKETLEEKFKENKDANVILIDEPQDNCFIIELSLTEAKKTIATANFLKMISGLKFLGLLSSIKKGSVAVEGRIIDFNTKEILESFADRRKDKTVWIFSFKEYMWFGHAEENIETWCEEIVKLFIGDPKKNKDENNDDGKHKEENKDQGTGKNKDKKEA